MPNSNFLISSLESHDFRLLKPHLREIHLQQRTVLFNQDDLMQQVYFPLGAVISLVISLSTGETIEAAMIGRDGAVGIACALDGRISPSRAVVQMSGDVLVCNADPVKRAAM